MALVALVIRHLLLLNTYPGAVAAVPHKRRILLILSHSGSIQSRWRSLGPDVLNLNLHTARSIGLYCPGENGGPCPVFRHHETV